MASQDTLQLFERIEKEFPLKQIRSYNKREVAPLTPLNIQTLAAMEHGRQSLYFGLFVRSNHEESRQDFAIFARQAHHARCMALAMIDPNEAPLETLVEGELALVYNYAQKAQTEPNKQVRTLFEYIVYDHLEHVRQLQGDLQRITGDKLESFTKNLFTVREGRPFNQQELPPDNLIQGPLQNQIDPMTWSNILLMKSAERHAHMNYLAALKETTDSETRIKCETYGQIEMEHAMMLGSLYPANLTEWARAVMFEYGRLQMLRQMAQQETDPQFKQTFQRLVPLAEETLRVCGQLAQTFGKVDLKLYSQSTLEQAKPQQSVDDFLQAHEAVRTKQVTPKMTITMMPEQAKQRTQS